MKQKNTKIKVKNISENISKMAKDIPERIPKDISEKNIKKSVRKKSGDILKKYIEIKKYQKIIAKNNIISKKI